MTPPPSLGPYGRTLSRALWWSWGGGLFLMSEVPLYTGIPMPASGSRDKGLGFRVQRSGFGVRL